MSSYGGGGYGSGGGESCSNSMRDIRFESESSAGSADESQIHFIRKLDIYSSIF